MCDSGPGNVCYVHAREALERAELQERALSHRLIITPSDVVNRDDWIKHSRLVDKIDLLQRDVDSTPEGQDILAGKIASASSPEDVKAFTKRKQDALELRERRNAARTHYHQVLEATRDEAASVIACYEDSVSDLSPELALEESIKCLDFMSKYAHDAQAQVDKLSEYAKSGDFSHEKETLLAMREALVAYYSSSQRHGELLARMMRGK